MINDIEGSQELINKCLRLSQQGDSIDKLLSVVEPHIKPSLNTAWYQGINMVALLHSHYAALQYLMQNKPEAFDIPKYQQLFERANIKKVLEIGPWDYPLAEPLKNMLNLDFETTYIGDELPPSHIQGKRISGYFPNNIPENEKYDLIIACGVFSFDGQIGPYTSQHATYDLINISIALSDNPNSVGMNISRSAPTLEFDKDNLSEKNILLFYNTPDTLYQRDAIWEKLGRTDLIIVKKTGLGVKH